MIDKVGFFVYDIVIGWWPLIGTFILGHIAWILWAHYVRNDFMSGIEWAVLEVVPPRDVLRSPKAMELFFTNALYQATNKQFLEKFWRGHVRFWFSLEIASIEGNVHFYVRVPSRLVGLVQTQMYAQYPQANVKVVPDYTLAVDEISEKSAWNLWGFELKLSKSDPYPIKTYVDFGLDKDPKEEYKIDPISPLVELFGAIERGEQMWLQIIVRVSEKKYHTHGTLWKHHTWEQESEHEMEKLTEQYTKVSSDEHSKKSTKEIRPPKWLEGVIDGISRKTTKLGFETGIRAVYVAKKESFSNNSRRNMRLIFRQYAAPYLNGFERVNSVGFQYPWAHTESAAWKLKDRMRLEYQERALFHHPLRSHIYMPFPLTAFVPRYNHPHIFVLNTEELATIWHFPGQIMQVPGLERIESKEAAPPTNLPM